jgi:TolB-like protein/tetratricopeptide (TPR) repeat protein
MMKLLAQLKQRQMFRVAAAYAVVAWLLIQLVNNLAPMLRLPEWAGSFFLVLLLIGLPVVLVFAWVHELESASEDGALARVKTGKLDWTLIGALILVIGLVSYQQLTTSSVTQQAGVEAAKAAAASPRSGISLAVLPFVNLSSDKEQEFFSDGVTEEITTALAKIPDLRVVARESAFQYKGEKNDMRTVGLALNATHLIGGSVRKSGDRVRITAQLVKADDGVSVWADSYDRELTDIFAIQEDIARAIATSLRMPLGLKQGENLVSSRPADQQTYELYLRGVNALRTRSRQELVFLEQVVARDPNYAPGWAKLGEARLEMSIYYERGGEESKLGLLLDGAETAAKKAIALAPAYAGGYGALAGLYRRRGNWTEAMDTAKQGLAHDPDEPELLFNYSLLLRALGYLKEALNVREQLALLEPLIPLYNRHRAELLLTNGMTDAGLSELQRLDRQRNAGAPAVLFLWAALAQQGRFAEAADALLRGGPSPLTEGPYTQPLIDAAAQVLRAAANKSDPPAQLPAFDSELNFVYAYTSMPERMLEWPESTMKEGDYRPIQFAWWPTPSSVRKTERFKTLVRNAGLVDYWKARGWPDLCKPVGANDFTCE